MLLQILNNPHAFGPLEIIFIAIACIVIGAVLGVLLLREKAHLAAQAAAPVVDTTTPEPTTTGGFKLRKIAPHLLALGFLVLFVLLQFALKHVPALDASPAAVPLPSSGVLPDVDGATQEVAQATGGYVQLGTLVSKLVTMVVIFSLFSFLPWDFQKLTHPGVAKWKKEFYTQEFLALPSEEKFKESRGIGLARAVIAGAAILGACFIQ